MAVTVQDIKAHFPEFSGTSAAVIERWKDQAERRVNLAQWAGKADDGIMWLTAHLLKVQCMMAAGTFVAPGPVTMKKTGDLSESYAVSPRLSRSSLSSTSYGQYFLDLQGSIFPTRVLGSCCNGA